MCSAYNRLFRERVERSLVHTFRLQSYGERTIYTRLFRIINDTRIRFETLAVFPEQIAMQIIADPIQYLCVNAVCPEQTVCVWALESQRLGKVFDMDAAVAQLLLYTLTYEKCLRHCVLSRSD